MPKYINNIKIKQGKFGLKMSGNLDKLVEELRQHTNEKGYFNLEIKERKEVGKYGESHSVTVDEWKPNDKPVIGGHNKATDWDDPSSLPF